MRRQRAPLGALVRLGVTVLGTCLLLACRHTEAPVVTQPPSAAEQVQAPPVTQPGAEVAAPFDYYVLAMSWSPQFCGTRQTRSDDPQCGDGKRFGFIAHGLWPQFQKGFPESCPTTQSFDPGLVPRVLPIMPSEKLMRHEWEKHGTCSGLTATDYFARLERIYRGVQIPERYAAPTEEVVTSLAELKQAFMQKNPGLEADMFAVLCGAGGYLREVRICFSREGRLQRCSEMVRDQCRGEQLSVRPLRGAAAPTQ